MRVGRGRVRAFNRPDVRNRSSRVSHVLHRCLCSRKGSGGVAVDHETPLVDSHSIEVFVRLHPRIVHEVIKAPVVFDGAGHESVTLRCVGYLAWPYFPEKMAELLGALGEDSSEFKVAWSRTDDFLALRQGYVFGEVPKLFARVDVNAELAKLDATAAKPAEKASPPVRPSDTIGIEEFAKIDVRVGTVVSAEVVEGSDKLLRLQVSLGELGTRQIFSGIRPWIKPEEIVNRCVLVVVNLAPRKMKFGMSEGMVLSADTVTGGVCPVYASETLKEGARLS